MRRDWKKEKPTLIKILNNQGAEAACEYYGIGRPRLLTICKKHGIYIEKKEIHYAGDGNKPDMPEWLIKRRNEVMLSVPLGNV